MDDEFFAETLNTNRGERINARRHFRRNRSNPLNCSRGVEIRKRRHFIPNRNNAFMNIRGAAIAKRRNFRRNRSGSKKREFSIDFKMMCVACDKPFKGLIDFSSHLTKDSHKTMQLMKDDDPQWLSSVSFIKWQMRVLIERHEWNDYGDYYCQFCDKKNTGVVPLMCHFRSTGHEKCMRKAEDKLDIDAFRRREQMALWKEEEWLSGVNRCKLCQVTMKDKTQYKCHKQGKRHFRNEIKIKCARMVLMYFDDRYPLCY